MTVFTWSTTASSNATADGTINAREQQAPSTLNDSIRALMAAVAKWRNDLSGNLATGGSATAYTLSTGQGFTSLVDGAYIRARVHATNGRAATLNVDSLGAKALASAYGTALRPGFLVSGGVFDFVYDSTDDKWIVGGAPGQDVLVGEIKAYSATTAPAGWVRCNGRTIGNASSSASERANADTEDLFTHLWDNYSNSVCAVSSGRGASAAADYASNKTISLPDLRGRALFGLDDMGNSAASRITSATLSDGTTNGNSGGAQTTTIAQANLPNVTLTFSATTSSNGDHSHTYEAEIDAAHPSGAAGIEPRGRTIKSTSTAGAHTHTVSGNTSSINGGVTQTAMANMPPAFLTTFIIRL